MEMLEKGRACDKEDIGKEEIEIKKSISKTETIKTSDRRKEEDTEGGRKNGEGETV